MAIPLSLEASRSERPETILEGRDGNWRVSAWRTVGVRNERETLARWQSKTPAGHCREGFSSDRSTSTLWVLFAALLDASALVLAFAWSVVGQAMVHARPCHWVFFATQACPYTALGLRLRQ
jgi:hypothetical protein